MWVVYLGTTAASSFFAKKQKTKTASGNAVYTSRLTAVVIMQCVSDSEAVTDY